MDQVLEGPRGVTHTRRLLSSEEVHGDTAEHSDDARDRTTVAAMDILRRILRSLQSARRESARLGVSAAQLFVLREISKADTLTVTELARRTATTQSSVSEVVARLLERGLLTRRRSTEDRRRADLTLSESGRRLLAQGPETIQERLLSAFNRLPAQTRHAAVDGLKAWLDEAGLSDIEPTMFFEAPRAERRD